MLDIDDGIFLRGVRRRDRGGRKIEIDNVVVLRFGRFARDGCRRGLGVCWIGWF